MLNKTLSYLHLKDIGGLELLVALYPILAGYGYGAIHGNLFFILIAVFIASLNRRRKQINLNWLIGLISFVFIHELILMMVIPVRGYFINNTFSILIISFSIIPIVRTVDYQKFVGSLNWISILSIFGLLYQVPIVMRGGIVSPIKLPFMPNMDVDSRLYELGMRPSSFFWEPAALVTFLMIPLFISLVQKRYIWTAILMVSMFLSTSSTGILMSFVMFIVYVLTHELKTRTRLSIIAIGLVLLYVLLHSSYFEQGINKIETTDAEKNTRIMNGFFLYEELNTTEKLFGIAAANVDEYYEKNGGFYFGEDKVFVPSFWLTLAKYGVFGLFLFLGLYYNILRRDKTLLPYIMVIYISMFFQGIGFGNSGFAFQLIFLYSYISRNKKMRLVNKINC